MKLADLKTRIQETLGLDVISMPALATCVNNCIASLESKGYREYFEEELDLIKTTQPFTVNVPSTAKRLVYVKVKMNEGIYKCERLPLTDPYLQTRKVGDEFRVPVEAGLVYYVKGTTIYIDSGNELDDIQKVIVGCDKKIQPVALSLTEAQMNDADNPTTLDIRADLDNAFVLYGLQFFANRYRFRPETVDMFTKDYKYYVEDIMVQMDREDAYVEEQEITIVIE